MIAVAVGIVVVIAMARVEGSVDDWPCCDGPFATAAAVSRWQWQSKSIVKVGKADAQSAGKWGHGAARGGKRIVCCVGGACGGGFECGVEVEEEVVGWSSGSRERVGRSNAHEFAGLRREDGGTDKERGRRREKLVGGGDGGGEGYQLARTRPVRVSGCHWLQETSTFIMW